MQVIFCRPDGAQALADRFELEALALDELDVPYTSLSLEAVVDDDLDAQEDALASLAGGPTLYRGWMLTLEEYERLAEAVSAHGSYLLVSPEEYEAAHYLPSYFPAIEKRTAPTRWTWDRDPDEAWLLAQELGPPPYILKDHVKSAKERFDEACFVPAGADRAAFKEVCEALIEARGDRFEGGLVIRAYQDLAPAPTDTPTGESEEYRLFFFGGRLLDACPQFDAPGDLRGLDSFAELGRAIDSPFFTVDVARRVRGDLMVVEVGDGGVSTLPPTADVRAFYRKLAARWRSVAR